MGLTQEFEQKLWAKDILPIGIDEAGRGPMAGPCVVAGVIFPKGYNNPLINDSKKLSEKKRQELKAVILEDALYYDVQIIDVETIDKENIYQATKHAMMSIATKADTKAVLTDAMPFALDNKDVRSIVKGDQKSISIAGASILAKTIRDEIMIELDTKYPEYGFKNHKGYGTKAHKEAILKHGRCEAHRNSFKFKEEVLISLDI